MICDLFQTIVVEEGLSARGLPHIAHDQVLLRYHHLYRGVCEEPSRINRVDSDAFLIELIVEIAPGGILDWDSVGHKKTCGTAGEVTAGEPKHILSTGQLSQRDGYLTQCVEIG